MGTSVVYVCACQLPEWKGRTAVLNEAGANASSDGMRLEYG